eukprot:130811-Rhodomonas_salina.1
MRPLERGGIWLLLLGCLVRAWESVGRMCLILPWQSCPVTRSRRAGTARSEPCPVHAISHPFSRPSGSPSRLSLSCALSGWVAQPTNPFRAPRWLWLCCKAAEHRRSVLFLSVEPEVGLGCRQETNTFYFMTQLIFDIFIQILIRDTISAVVSVLLGAVPRRARCLRGTEVACGAGRWYMLGSLFLAST